MPVSMEGFYHEMAVHINVLNDWHQAGCGPDAYHILWGITRDGVLSWVWLSFHKGAVGHHNCMSQDRHRFSSL